ncbi:hypothetical protein KIPB_015481, partial [Kipferlia bialata]|eukprot:g15481.t1
MAVSVVGTKSFWPAAPSLGGLLAIFGLCLPFWIPYED